MRQSIGVPDVRWVAHQWSDGRVIDLEKSVLSEQAASGSDQRGTEVCLPWPPPRTFTIMMSDTRGGLSVDELA
jgi:hypothetical protein